jgi:hypothetical protein
MSRSAFGYERGRFVYQKGGRAPRMDDYDPGCVKTLRGMTAPGILRLVVTLRAKNSKIHPPLGVTTKSDFVFTQPGSQAGVLIASPATLTLGRCTSISGPIAGPFRGRAAL